jgi:uncharacterized protein (DUF1697 family)
MLRGINVGGKKSVKMDELKKLYESLGFSAVSSYIQSGNVIFKFKKTDPTVLVQKIERQIIKKHGFSVPVVIRTLESLGKTIENNPFLKKKVDPSKLHVTFLSGIPQKDTVDKMKKIDSGLDRFHQIEWDVYVYCPGGYGETKLSNNYFEKNLLVGATTRNWKTVTTLYEMAKTS